MNSRLKDMYPWCGRVAHCNNVKLLCRDMKNDLEAAKNLSRGDVGREPLRRGRIAVIRHEDLALHPEKAVLSLLKRLDLNEAFDAKHMLDTLNERTHHEAQSYKYNSLSRNATKVAFYWRNTLNFQQVSAIQEECREVMAELGYSVFNSQEEMLNGNIDSFTHHHSLTYLT